MLKWRDVRFGWHSVWAVVWLKTGNACAALSKRIAKLGERCHARVNEHIAALISIRNQMQAEVDKLKGERP